MMTLPTGHWTFPLVFRPMDNVLPDQTVFWTGHPIRSQKLIKSRDPKHSVEQTTSICSSKVAFQKFSICHWCSVRGTTER